MLLLLVPITFTQHNPHTFTILHRFVEDGEVVCWKLKNHPLKQTRCCTQLWHNGVKSLLVSFHKDVVDLLGIHTKSKTWAVCKRYWSFLLIVDIDTDVASCLLPPAKCSWSGKLRNQVDVLAVSLASLFLFFGLMMACFTGSDSSLDFTLTVNNNRSKMQMAQLKTWNSRPCIFFLVN